MSRVTCRSGIKGYQARLQQLYADFEEFQAFSNTYGLASRLGFTAAKYAWDRNPIVQGSVEPSDYRTVPEKEKRT